MIIALAKTNMNNKIKDKLTEYRICFFLIQSFNKFFISLLNSNNNKKYLKKTVHTNRNFDGSVLPRKNMWYLILRQLEKKYTGFLSTN